MFQDFYAQSRHLIWPLVGMLIFLANFITVAIYVLVGLGDKQKRQQLSRLPLESDGTDSMVPVTTRSSEEKVS